MPKDKTLSLNKKRRVKEYTKKIDDKMKGLVKCKEKSIQSETRQQFCYSSLNSFEYKRRVLCDKECLEMMTPPGFHQIMISILNKLLIHEPLHTYFYIWQFLEYKLVKRDYNETAIDYCEWFNEWRIEQDKIRYCDPLRCTIYKDKEAKETLPNTPDTDLSYISEEEELPIENFPVCPSEQFICESVEEEESLEGEESDLEEARILSDESLDIFPVEDVEDSPQVPCHDIPLPHDPPLNLAFFFPTWKQPGLALKKAQKEDKLKHTEELNKCPKLPREELPVHDNTISEISTITQNKTNQLTCILPSYSTGQIFPKCLLKNGQISESSSQHTEQDYQTDIQDVEPTIQSSKSSEESIMQPIYQQTSQLILKCLPQNNQSEQTSQSTGQIALKCLLQNNQQTPKIIKQSFQSEEIHSDCHIYQPIEQISQPDNQDTQSHKIISQPPKTQPAGQHSQSIKQCFQRMQYFKRQIFPEPFQPVDQIYKSNRPSSQPASEIVKPYKQTSKPPENSKNAKHAKGQMSRANQVSKSQRQTIPQIHHDQTQNVTTSQAPQIQTISQAPKDKDQTNEQSPQAATLLTSQVENDVWRIINNENTSDDEGCIAGPKENEDSSMAMKEGLNNIVSNDAHQLTEEEENNLLCSRIQNAQFPDTTYTGEK